MPKTGGESGGEGGDQIETKPTEGVDTTTTDQNKSGTESTDSGAEGESGEADGEKDKSADGDNKDEEADDDGKDPEIRPRSKESFILERKERKAAKQKGDKGDNKKGGEEVDEEAEEDEDENLEPSPEDEKLIDKVIDKKLQPLFQKQEEEETKTAVTSFVTANPDFKPFQAKIERYALHPSRKHLPIKSIAYEVAGEKLLQIGAQRGKEADQKAQEHKAGGGTAGGESGSKSVWDLTPEEFKAKQAEVLSKRRD